MTTYMTATDARKKFYAVIDAAGNAGMPVVITHDGVPKAVVLSFEEYEGWQETMEIMADPELSRDILNGVQELKGGKVPSDAVSLEEVRQKLHL
jgi:antitoxin YefM